MALTADQTAILELLLAGNKTYADLGALLDLDEDEVRLRAREALGEVGGSDPDRNVGLSAYLLGQADPIGRADAVRHLRQDAEDHALATEIAARLREIVPGADLPELPAGAAGGRSRRPAVPMPRTRTTKATGGPGFAERVQALAKHRRYPAIAGGAVILILLVLAITGVFSGEDEPSSAPASTTADPLEGSTTPGEVAGEEASRIPLAPIGNGDAAGEGVVGITTGDQPYLDLSLENLEPAPRDQVYVIWFLFDAKNGYPLSPIAPDAQGNYEDRFAVPSAAIPVLQRMRFLNVSLAPVDAVRTAIEKAVSNERIVIERPGRTILQNTQPLAAAAPQGSGGG